MSWCDFYVSLRQILIAITLTFINLNDLTLSFMKLMILMALRYLSFHDIES